MNDHRRDPELVSLRYRRFSTASAYQSNRVRIHRRWAKRAIVSLILLAIILAIGILALRSGLMGFGEFLRPRMGHALVRIELPQPDKGDLVHPANSTTSRMNNALQAANSTAANVQSMLMREQDKAGSQIAKSGAPSKLATGSPEKSGSTLNPVLPLEFDLGDLPDAASALEIHKRVLVDGKPKGELRLQIDRNSEVYADAEDIVRILPSLKGKIDISDHKFVSFDQIRDAGAGLRYDAVKDVVLVSSP